MFGAAIWVLKYTVLFKNNMCGEGGENDMILVGRRCKIA